MIKFFEMRILIYNCQTHFNLPIVTLYIHTYINYQSTYFSVVKSKKNDCKVVSIWNESKYFDNLAKLPHGGNF